LLEAGRCPWLRLVPTLAAILVVLTIAPPPNTGAANCANIEVRYKQAVETVVAALHGYEACVAASNQRQDCAAQMQVLDSAHDGFAQAVADSQDCQ
jgi:hypothetical protein